MSMRKMRSLLLVLFCLYATGCSIRGGGLSSESPTTPSEYSTPMPTGTLALTATAEKLPSPSHTATDVPQYEVLSPVAIRKGNIVIEVVSYTISDSTFRFGVRFSGLDPLQIPDTSPEGVFSPVSKVIFFHKTTRETPLEVELIGGGGGGGVNGDGAVTINQDFSYKLMQTFPVGQAQHLVAVVTLHPIFGIIKPIRFELEIVPQAGIQG